ncbi:MAG TPA: iron chelate uptake ABC transporter family permease subunit, partial [Bacillota bacterium]|nr:iron chelate uptake ABC transporter family permease subunit [Bacillota bacterium]
NSDLWLIGSLAFLIILVFTLFYREIQLVLYNPELAESLGAPVKLIRYGLLLLSGLAIGVSIKMVGALLIDAAVLLPGVAAMALGRSLKAILLWSALLGVISQLGGLVVSMMFDLPSGASITLTAVILLCICEIVSRVKKIKEGT